MGNKGNFSFESSTAAITLAPPQDKIRRPTAFYRIPALVLIDFLPNLFPFSRDSFCFASD
jgi:hypothetical protein